MSRDEDRAKAHEKTGKSAFDAIKEMVDWYNAAVAADNQDALDSTLQTIHEDPLSVMVRDGWRLPGGHTEEGPEEYEILLSTGGPATRIVGNLDKYCQPETARLEVQDWFVPWQEWRGEGYSETVLLTYAQCFYFGE